MTSPQLERAVRLVEQPWLIATKVQTPYFSWGSREFPSDANFQEGGCICGECSTGQCQPRAILQRWLHSRWESPVRNFQVSSIPVEIRNGWDSLATPPLDEAEGCGLAFLESILPLHRFRPQQNNVCRSCQGIGSRSVPREEPGTRSDNTASSDQNEIVMSIYRIKAATRYCLFCRFLNRILQEIVRPAHLYSFRASVYETGFRAVYCILRDTHTFGNRSFKKKSAGDRFITLDCSPAPFPLVDFERNLVLHYIALSSEDVPSTSGRLVSESQIDLPVLKSWLSECIESHGDVCNGRHIPNADGKLHSLRVVDVLEKCVVRQASTLPYVALSYVWGQTPTLQLTQENETELCQPGALLSHSSQIPQTLLDAFDAVKALGERYLWVDALCIVQNASDKEMHLQDMHLIYGAALLTIIAAQGNDASAGLRGIRPGSRSLSQPFVKIDDGVGMAVSLPLPNVTNRTRWSSRAWTYQEQLLSKRFLLFAGDQVIWQCPKEVICEDDLADNKAEVFQRLQTMSALADASSPAEDHHQPEVRYGFRRPRSMQRYTDIVVEYTSRRLTFSEDILRAFSGLAQIFMLDLNTEIVEGLPLSHLDVALLWQPCQRLRRREGSERFASWSWARWEGQVVYEDTRGRNGIEGVIPLVKWTLLRSQLINKFGVGIMPSLLAPGISNQTAPFEPTHGDRTNSNFSLLRFWTSCAFFGNLVERRREEDAPTQCQIRSGHGQPIGVLTMTGADSVSKLNPSRHEYVVVSEAQFKGFDMVSWAPTFSGERDECRMYNVMLIEWNEQRTCAYRVGLGRVLKIAWWQATPKPCNKQITLG